MAERADQTRALLIGLEAAKADFDQHSALFVDVRDYEEYRHSHIPGAISVPLKEIFGHLGELSRNRRIIFG